MRLQGQRALVTGASRGMGRAIAIAFAHEGADIAITARDEKLLASLHDEVTSVGVRCALSVADLSVRDEVHRTYDELDSELGPFDILVNNAGIGSSSHLKHLVDYDDAVWDEMMFVNATAPYLLCKRALPGMMERKHGRIITISSIIGKVGLELGVAYAASKHAVLGLTRTIAIEAVKHGVTANSICPGAVSSLMNDKRLRFEANRRGITFEEMKQRVSPIGRRLEPEEIAQMAVYLASDEARGITGQSFNIDGGALQF